MNEENEGVETEVLGSEDQEGVETETEVRSAEDQDDTDWKAIADKALEERDHYKLALTQKRQLRNTPAPVIEEDEDAPLTRKDFERLLQSTVVPLVATSKEDTLLTQKVSDPAKREYVKFLLESRIVRTGTSDTDITNDIEEAIWLADRKKVQKETTELRRVAANRPSAPSAGGSSEPIVEKKPYKIDAATAAHLDQRAKLLGVDPEKFKTDYFNNLKKTKTLG